MPRRRELLPYYYTLLLLLLLPVVLLRAQERLEPVVLTIPDFLAYGDPNADPYDDSYGAAFDDEYSDEYFDEYSDDLSVAPSRERRTTYAPDILSDLPPPAAHALARFTFPAGGAVSGEAGHPEEGGEEKDGGRAGSDGEERRHLRVLPMGRVVRLLVQFSHAHPAGALEVTGVAGFVAKPPSRSSNASALVHFASLPPRWQAPPLHAPKETEVALPYDMVISEAEASANTRRRPSQGGEEARKCQWATSREEEGEAEAATEGYCTGRRGCKCWRRRLVVVLLYQRSNYNDVNGQAAEEEGRGAGGSGGSSSSSSSSASSVSEVFASTAFNESVLLCRPLPLSLLPRGDRAAKEAAAKAATKAAGESEAPSDDDDGGGSDGEYYDPFFRAFPLPSDPPRGGPGTSVLVGGLAVAAALLWYAPRSGLPCFGDINDDRVLDRYLLAAMPQPSSSHDAQPHGQSPPRGGLAERDSRSHDGSSGGGGGGNGGPRRKKGKSGGRGR